MSDINPQNLAASIDAEELQKIGVLCVQEYDADVTSRSNYDERRAKWLKLFGGDRGKKTFPWDGAANTHVPLLAEACLQFQARAYEALVPAKEIVKGLSRDGQSKDSAERVATHMNWQLQYDMDEWEENMDAALLLLPLMGSAYKKVCYDPTLKRPMSITLSADEFVTPYRCKRLEDAPRKTHVIWMHLNDIAQRAEDKTFINVDEKWEGQDLGTKTPMPEYTQTADAAQGATEPTPEYTNKRIILEQHRLLDINYDPVQNKFLKKGKVKKPYVVWVDYETRKVLRITSRLWWDELRAKWHTIEYFIPYTFIPNPDSHYGFGFAHLIDHINETADTILNQLIDAGTLSNLKGGFVNQRSGIKKGALTFKMGEYKGVDIASDDIRKAIYELNFEPPSATLFTLLDMLKGYVKDLTTTADWMSGALPPSDTAATTMLAIIEQGLKVFSTIQKRCHRSFGRELRQIAFLNGIYLDEKVYYVVQDSTADSMKTLETGRQDYLNNIDVIPVSDPNITSRAEQLIKAQQILGEVKQNPLTMQDPESLYIATREYMKALGAGVLTDQIVKKPPPPPEPPDLTPQEENAMFLREQSVEPLPIQDHLTHLFNHETFMQSEWGTRLTPQGKNVYEAHIKDTLALAYMAEEGQKMAQFEAQQGQPIMTEGAPTNGGQPDTGGMEGVGNTDLNEMLYDRISNAAGGIVGGLA